MTTSPNSGDNNTERRIDELVYELYGLTEEEVAVVEGENQRALSFEHISNIISRYFHRHYTTSVN